MNHFRGLLLVFMAVLTLSSPADAQQDTLRTEHGFLFVNHTQRQGDYPKAEDYVIVRVETWLGDTLLSSTSAMGGSREIQIPTPERMPKRVPPFFDAIVLMTRGDSATVLQPVDSLIRKLTPQRFHDEKYLRFDIVLLDFMSAAERDRKKQEETAVMEKRLTEVEAQTQQLAKDFKKGKLKDQLEKTRSGLQYIVHEPGTGPLIAKGDNVSVHYYGCLMNGEKFDESFSPNMPLPFVAGEGQMIAGFDEGVLLLRHGARATLFLPARLAYGQEGAGDVIPPNSDLIFYIEIQ
ncbi:MAG: FKBP-type peptidyl-prolyl cis-trans isomerase [Saprospiraceae bacterium]|nr:FKBP-type peptidyl-prolyl cis-trans isomerase [Saprospiraceae bacterium]